MPAHKDKTIALFADTHCGGSTGLMRPHRQYSFNSGLCIASQAQEIIWQRYAEYAAIVREERRKRQLVVVFAGDAIDGKHHDTLQLVTHDEAEQAQLFIDCMEYFLKETGFGKGDRLYMVNGTEPTHGSKNTTHQIAERLEAIPFREATQFGDLGTPLDGWYPHQHLKLEVNGRLLDIQHHPAVGLGKKPWLRGNALRSHIIGEQMRLSARRQTLPDYWIAAHRHTTWEETVRFDNGTPDRHVTNAFLLPCFQFKTEFPYRIGITEPTAIGGMWIQIDGDGATRHKCEFTELTQPEDEVIKL